MSIILEKSSGIVGKVENWVNKYREKLDTEDRKNRKKFIGASNFEGVSFVKKTPSGFTIEIESSIAAELPSHLKLENSINDLYLEVLSK
jgi:hypothetical protein